MISLFIISYEYDHGFSMPWLHYIILNLCILENVCQFIGTIGPELKTPRGQLNDCIIACVSSWYRDKSWRSHHEPSGRWCSICPLHLFHTVLRIVGQSQRIIDAYYRHDTWYSPIAKVRPKIHKTISAISI